MTPPATPLVIERPRSAEQIAAALRPLLEHEGFASTRRDPLLEALVGVAARYAEIVTACVNEAPRLHLQAFSEFVAGDPRPASAASVHLAFSAAPGVFPVVVPRYTRVASAPAPGDTAPVVFETSDDLTLLRAHLVQAWYVDPGHRRVADMAAMLAAPGRGEGDPLQAALPVVQACHLGQRDAFGLLGLREVRVRVRIAPGPAREPSQLEWGVASDKGFVPLAVRSDTTLQMTHDGEVVLEAPPAWGALAIEDIESRWLTVRPSASALLAEAYAPPRVAGVSFVVLAAVPPQPIVAACHGLVPLDISKDFYPLGERPRFGEVFQVLCPALVEAGAHIELHVLMTNPQGAASSPIPPVSRDGKPLVAWEIPTVDGYRALVAADGTRSLTQDGTLAFTVPADVVRTTIAGHTGVWLRARLVSGTYGSVVVADAGGFPMPCAPSIRSLTAVATLERGPIEPDAVICEGALTRKVLDHTTSTPFDLFVASDVEGPALYLGFESPGVPLGAVLTAGRLLCLHVRPAPPAMPITLDDEDAPQSAPRWQVYGGGSWREANVVRDDSNGMARSGIVQVRLTHEASPWAGLSLDPKTQFGWLRVTWPGAPDAARTLPLGLALNAVAATHTQRLRNEVLGSSNGRSAQVFKALRTPIIGDVLLQVREHDDQWLTWEEVDDLSDSTAAARHFTLDRLTGEVHFGDGRQGRIPPAGANNILFLAYAAGGGRQGNRTPLSITLPQSAVPAVESVVNLEAASGGMDAETRSQVRARASTWLRHRDRAVCASDHADLALVASPDVARAYCFAGRDLAAERKGTAATVEPDAAVISLIVVPHSDSARPQPDAALLATVKAYLDARRFPAGRLVIVGPTYASVSVKLEISVRGDWSPHEVAMACEKRVTQFLHPLAGGSRGQGWAPDERPHRSDLYSLVGAIDGVDFVHGLSLAVDAMPGVPFIVAAGTVLGGIAP
ncbi:putative baseplate assembly protein [Variovorax sp. GT1P44]|uniref:putative baseplate assembly protein n=1 Tax=Variovorax sp. GT1P44 TaxID=3443742 RepID=UPI003F453A73